MSFQVLDASTQEGRAAWIALWSRWPDREIMAHPEYARLFARPGDRAVAVVGGTADAAILLPLLLRPLAAEPWARPGERRWDAATPYGYGGAFTWGDAAAAAPAFWREYGGFCADERIVATFARLSLFPEQLAPMPGRVETRLTNVVRSLDDPMERIWRDYAPKVRKNVHAAERAGLRVEVDGTGARLDAFLAIYSETMRRRDAAKPYHFPRRFFEDIVARLAPHFAFFHVLSGETVVSTELVLCSAHRLYSFLGGTHEEAFRLRPNDLLKHHVVTWGIEQGKRAYVLGGGYTDGDGIYRYKLAFAPRGAVPFHVTCAVHDERGYAELVATRAEAEGRRWVARPGFFPAYRA